MTESDRYERFIKWAKERGHYQAYEASLRFESYEASLKRHANDALMDRAKDED